MSGLIRVTLDTNILVSALITEGTPPDLLYRGWRDEKFQLVTSSEQLKELRRVLAYPKLKQYIDPFEAKELLGGLQIEAIIASDLSIKKISRDPADDVIIATAIKGGSKFLVTGDKEDLLSLKKIGSIAIITAKKAIELLGIENKA